MPESFVTADGHTVPVGTMVWSWGELDGRKLVTSDQADLIETFFYLDRRVLIEQKLKITRTEIKKSRDKVEYAQYVLDRWLRDEARLLAALDHDATS